MRRVARPLMVVGIGVVLVLLLPYSYRAHNAALVLAGITTVGCILWGMRRYRPQHPEIWGGFAAATACWTTSFGLRLAFPDQLNPLPTGELHITDYIDLSGYVLAIIFLHRTGRLRDDSSDPTTVIDSVILAGGASTIIWLLKLLPLLEDKTLVDEAQRWAVIMTLLAVGLAFCMVRIILTSSQKTVSSTRLGYAAFLCTAAENSTLSPSSEINNTLMTIGTVALVFLALAAVHPTMVSLSADRQRSRDIHRFGRITFRRIAMMTAAILIAPAALLWKVTSGDLVPLVATCLIGSWGVVTIFVMLRIAGLMRVREQIARSERTLSQAASSFVTATDAEDTYDAALRAMWELTGSGQPALALIVMRRDEHWVTVDALGDGATAALESHFDDATILPALDGHLPARLQLAKDLAPYVVDPDNMVVVAPLEAHHQTRGALLLFCGQPLNALVATSVNTLAGSVALALEAAALAENLHQRRSEQRFRSLVENSRDLILVIDSDFGTSFASPSVERLLGGSEHPDFRTLLTLIPQGDRPSVLSLVQSSGESSAAHSVEFRIEAGGETQWFEATISDLHHDEQVNGVVFNARNISERKSLEEDLRHKVLHDSLTGIANRVLFRDRLDHALSLRRNVHSALVAVLFIDIDDFKTVNDGLGHDVGDELLKILALRLETFTRNGDTAARLGGDEFAILFEGFYTIEDVMAAANRLLEVIIQPVSFGDRDLDVSASIGVAIANDDSTTSEILLRNADVAMYHSKQTGKNRVKLFDQAMYVSAFERLELKHELGHALERNEFTLAYQPIVRLVDNQLIGFEALMRWTHPHLGTVAPGSFIPLTEESGLIVPIGAWALMEACRQLADWRQRFQVDVFVSVNVSPRQLEDDAIVDHVRNAVETSGIDPSWLTLELTESAGLNDPDSHARLVALRELGCQIAADDFGTGFASYAALQQLPFTSVKIDRSLITGLSNENVRAIEQVKSIIQMGHGIGLAVTAEGIENEKQVSALVELQADYGQGYGLGRPAGREGVEEHMKRAAQLIRNDC